MVFLRSSAGFVLGADGFSGMTGKMGAGTGTEMGFVGPCCTNGLGLPMKVLPVLLWDNSLELMGVPFPSKGRFFWFDLVLDTNSHSSSSADGGGAAVEDDGAPGILWVPGMPGIMPPVPGLLKG